jgi:hypothetical protein
MDKTEQVANDLLIYNANLDEDSWEIAVGAIEFLVDSLIKNEILSESFKTGIIDTINKKQSELLEDFFK